MRKVKPKSGVQPHQRPSRRAKTLRGIRLSLRPVLVAAALVSGGLVAADNSPYYVGVSQTFGHESNLLRLTDGATVPPDSSKSDTYSSTALLAGIDQPFGRQRLKGDAAFRMNRYNANDQYNNDSYSVSLGLEWATVNRLSGNLSASANRSLASFNLQEQGTLRTKNFEDTRSLDASVRLGLVTQYSLTASAGHREVTNSLESDTLQARNFQQDTGSVGIRWQPSSLLNVGLGLRSTEGKYPKFRNLGNNSFEADRFKRNDIDLTAEYQPSGASTLNARLSSGKTSYDLASQRDFSGVTGALTWNWQATGKLRVNTSLSRDTGQESYAVAKTTTPTTPTTADYSRINTTLRVGTDWAATSKIAVTSSLALSQRDLVASIPDSSGKIAPGEGREKYTTLSIGARWAPTRSSLVGCTASTDKLTNSGSGSLSTSSRIKGNSFNCFGQITLQ